MEDFIFDPETVVDDNLLPEGTYNLVVKEVSFEQNKKGTGHVLIVKTAVTSDASKNKWLWIRLNLIHDSEKVQNIGRAQFKKLLLAVELEGKFDFKTDLEKLVGKEFTSFVKIEDGYNSVKNFKKLDNLPF